MEINGKDRRSEREEVGYDDMEEDDTEKTRESSKHRNSKDSKKSSRRDDKDYRTKDRGELKEREKDLNDVDKDRVSGRERRRDDKDERGKDRNRDKVRDKDYDREKYRDKEGRSKEVDRKDRVKEKDLQRDRETVKISDRGRDKESSKEKSTHKDKEREKSKEKERGKHNDQETEKDNVKERSVTHDKERSRDSVSRRNRDEGHDKSKDSRKDDDHRDKYTAKKGKDPHSYEDDDWTHSHEQNVEAPFDGHRQSESELKDRILKMKEERLKPKSEGVPELLAWVNKSRKLEEKKNTEKEKALMLSKIFEEQDNIDQGETKDEDVARHTSEDLAGFKILHGLDKVMEGGAVVLTLKDQNILANGDINEDIDMLENVEIGEQKRREEAYKAAKKKAGVYEDKFNEDPGAEKKMLSQYDDPVADEGVTLDRLGKFTGEAEKKLEELRRRIEGGSANNRFEDLTTSGKISSDYYTNDEMLQFKKPKKKKSLRRKDKLDLDALEAEAVSAGLGLEDLGSRKDARRQAIKEEQRKYEAEKKSNAYQSAYAKANEASKALLEEHTVPVKKDEDENLFFADDDDDDLCKSLERARNLALKRTNEEKATGPQAIALLATTSVKHEAAEDENPTSGEPRENKVVFTEMEEFVWGLQLDNEDHKTYSEDVFMEEDEAPKASNEEIKDEAGGWAEIKETGEEETLVSEIKSEIVPDNTIHEAPVGKGLAGALKLLKERGNLKETVEWGGRNMDKKKSKLVGIYESDGPKEIHIERTDEFGRIMTPKEAFRTISHKFHGKGPGKMKLEKRQKQFQEEQKLKQMKNSDTPSHSVERMREAQLQSKSPYLVISGHVRPGQTSDPQSGFATVEKDIPGGLTPMLGDRKVDYLLGMKRNPSRLGNMGPPKKPKN